MTPRSLTKAAFSGACDKLFHAGGDTPIISDGHWAVELPACPNQPAMLRALQRLTGETDLAGDWTWGFTSRYGGFGGTPTVAFERKASQAHDHLRRMLREAQESPGVPLVDTGVVDRNTHVFRVGPGGREVRLAVCYATEAQRFELRGVPDADDLTPSPVRLCKAGRIVGILMVVRNP